MELFVKYRYSIDHEIRKALENIMSDPDKYENGNIKRILRSKHREDRDEVMTEEFIDLIAGMLTVDPEERLSIDEIVEHPYFDTVRKLPPMYELKHNQYKDWPGGKNPK